MWLPELGGTAGFPAKTAGDRTDCLGGGENRVIRDFRPEDAEEILRLVQSGTQMTEKRILARIRPGQAMVRDDVGIKGCAAWTIATPVDGIATAQVWIYTDPQLRGRGIGGSLWDAVEPFIKQLGAVRLMTDYRLNEGSSRGFFASKGFEKWFVVHDLVYEGPDFPEPGIDAVNYDDLFFADYLNLINESFAPLRQENDIEPYVIFGPEAFTSQEERDCLRRRREDLFVFLDNDRFVGIGLLEDAEEGDGNAVDIVAVRPEFRGRGYGRMITQFCINRLRDRGIRTPYIGVLGTNTVARRLYESMGCRLAESIEKARMAPVERQN